MGYIIQSKTIEEEIHMKGNDLKEIVPEGTKNQQAPPKEAVFDKQATEKAIQEAVDIAIKKKDQEIEQLNKSLDEEKKKDKYKPEDAPIPENQKMLPKGIQQSDIKTTVRDISEIIKEKMMQLKDMATMEVLLDTGVRMKNRLKSIKKLGSADHIKVRGIWKTTPPEMYIAKLEGKKINNDEFEISFGVYETDDKGNKKLYTHYADVLLRDGSIINRATSAEYQIAYEVIERIKTGKAITREVVRLNRVQEGE